MGCRQRFKDLYEYSISEVFSCQGGVSFEKMYLSLAKSYQGQIQFNLCWDLILQLGLLHYTCNMFRAVVKPFMMGVSTMLNKESCCQKRLFVHRSQTLVQWGQILDICPELSVNARILILRMILKKTSRYEGKYIHSEVLQIADGCVTFIDG